MTKKKTQNCQWNGKTHIYLVCSACFHTIDPYLVCLRWPDHYDLYPPALWRQFKFTQPFELFSNLQLSWAAIRFLHRLQLVHIFKYLKLVFFFFILCTPWKAVTKNNLLNSFGIIIFIGCYLVWSFLLFTVKMILHCFKNAEILDLGGQSMTDMSFYWTGTVFWLQTMMEPLPCFIDGCRYSLF